jgi:hypothetical protein
MKEIFDLWRKLIEQHPEYRPGQALFNAVAALDSAVAERLRQSDANPYYLDERVGQAIAWLYAQEDV